MRMTFHAVVRRVREILRRLEVIEEALGISQEDNNETFQAALAQARGFGEVEGEDEAPTPSEDPLDELIG